MKRFHGMLREEMERTRWAGLAVGPKEPHRFPDGSLFKLIQCPHCRLKGLPMYHAPNDLVYTSICQKCGARMVFHEKGVPVAETISGRQIHEDALVPKVHVGKGVVLDGNRLAEQHLMSLDMGTARMQRLGLAPAPGQHNRLQ